MKFFDLIGTLLIAAGLSLFLLALAWQIWIWIIAAWPTYLTFAAMLLGVGLGVAGFACLRLRSDTR